MSRTERPKTAVIGLTTAGLAWAGVLAKYGAAVQCTDMDEEIVNGCLEGEFPGECPGLMSLIAEGLKSKQLVITPNLRSLIRGNQVIFISCMLPADENDRPNLRFVEAIARQIANQCDEDKILVIKCGVPPKSTEKIQAIVDDILAEREVDHQITLAVMPDLYAGGEIIAAMERKGVLAVGVRDALPEALGQVLSVLPNQKRVKVDSWESVELSTFAYSALAAIRQTFINGLIGVCEGVDADYTDVIDIIRTHHRGAKDEHIGGVGFGGTQLPAEVAEFAAQAKDSGTVVPFTKQLMPERNKNVSLCVKRIRRRLGSIKGKTIALLGACGIEGTDDFRNSPALDVIKELINAGAAVQLYVPQGGGQVRWRLYKERDNILFCETPREAIKSADGIVVLGKWQGMNRLLTKSLAKVPKRRIIVDIAGGFDRKKAEILGFEYYR